MRRSRYQDKLNHKRWQRVRLATLDRDGWRCRQCGRAGMLQVHHVQHLEHGGAAYDLGNLKALCRDCHIKAHGGIPKVEDPGYAALVADLLAPRL